MTLNQLSYQFIASLFSHPSIFLPFYGLRPTFISIHSIIIQSSKDFVFLSMTFHQLSYQFIASLFSHPSIFLPFYGLRHQLSYQFIASLFSHPSIFLPFYDLTPTFISIHSIIIQSSKYFPSFLWP